MIIKKRFWEKFISIFSSVILLLNSFTPYLLIAPVLTPATAQEEIQTSNEQSSTQEDTQTENQPQEEIKQETSQENNQPSTQKNQNVVVEEQQTEVTTTTEETTTESANSQSDFQSALEETPVAEPSATLTPTIEPSPIPTPTPSPTSTAEVEKECFSETTKDTTNDDWNINSENQTAETREKVKLGIKYIFPLENKVSVTFKCLPKDESLRTTLKIQQIKISDLKLPEGVNPYGEYAYDITTSMTDGSFEYEITLPKPEDKAAQVSYIQKTSEELKNLSQPLSEEEIKPVEENKTVQEDNVVKVEGLDHFTIFILTYTSNTYLITKDLFVRGEHLYVKATGLTKDNSKYYRISLDEPSSPNDEWLGSWQKNVSQLTDESYVFDNQDNLGLWKAKIWEAEDSNGKNKVVKADHDFTLKDYISWPSSWDTPSCYSDPQGDENPDEIDLEDKGSSHPAASYKWGTDYLYLRERVDGDPGGPSNWHNYAWSVLIQTTPPFYQYLISLDGVSNKVRLYQNNQSSALPIAWTPSIFNDPADTILWEGDAGAYAAKNSDSNDYYIKIAVPLSILPSEITTNATLYFATAADANNFNKDHLNCYEPPQTGAIKITKDVVPNDSSTWNFTISGSGGNFYINGLGDGQSQIVSNLQPGSYNIVETTNSAYSTTVTCGEVGPLNQNGFLGTVVAGQTLECTFTNTKKTGSLTVHKYHDWNANGTKDDIGHNQYEPALSGWNIYVHQSPNCNDVAPLSLPTNNNGDAVFNNLTPGTYYVSEENRSDWYTKSPSCQQATVVENQNSTIEFGNYKKVEIRGFKYHDVDKSGGYTNGDLPLVGWKIYIDLNEDGNYDTGEPYGITDNNGSYSIKIDPGTYDIREELKPGWTQSYPPQGYWNESYFYSGPDYFGGFDFLNISNPVTIKAYKVVCDSESDLPNWGDDSSGQITATTAIDFVNQSNGRCRLAANWDFEWGFDGAAPKPLPDFYGYSGNPWKPFDSKTTNTNPATVVISDLQGKNRLWFKEVLQNNYIPFTYYSGNGVGSNVSAEFYCHDDHYKYDNYEYIDNPQYGQTYYCVGFNALKEAKINVLKVLDSDGNLTTIYDQTPAAGWEMTLDTMENPPAFVNAGTTDNDGRVTLSFNPQPGKTYRLTETIPAEYQYLSGYCKKNNQPIGGSSYGRVYAINVNAGETVDCTFINSLRGKILVKKFEDQNGNGQFENNENGLPGWKIELFNGPNCQNEMFSDDGTTDSYGNIKFENLITGEYSVKEILINGWQATTPICQNVSVYPGQTTTVNFGNFELGLIQGRKYEDLNQNGTRDTGESWLKDWTINLYDDQWHYLDSTKTQGTNGIYRFENLEKGTYYTCEELPAGWTQTGPTLNPPNRVNNQSPNASNEGPICWRSVINQSGQSRTGRQFGNIRYAKIIVDKVTNPANDSTEFSFNLIKDNELFDSFNLTDQAQPYENNQLTAGVYRLTEISQQGWTTTVNCVKNQNQPTITPTPTPTPIEEFSPDLLYFNLIDIVNAEETENNENLLDPENLVVNPGDEIICTFTNTYLPAALTIAKANDTGGISRAPGSVVNYRITLQVLDNDLKNVIVKDLLPPGFNFNGVWKVTVNGSEITVPNPNYASPGTWQLGDLKKNDLVVIEYPATINSDKNPGVYRDVAWAAGEDPKNGTVLALAQPEGYVDENFVGTEVLIAKELQTTSSINVEKKESGEVLGATTGLPATGGNTLWVIIASIASILGLLLISLGLALKKGKMKIFTQFLALFFVVSLYLMTVGNNVIAASLSIRLSTFQSPTYLNEFDLNFVALDLNNNPITVKCYYQKESSGYSQFGSDILLTAGGNSGSCHVTSAQINESGKTYYFYATAENGSEIVSSNIVSVDYNTSGPGTPVHYSKSQPSACEYKIKFKTADDGGKTVKVELYRSENTSFGIDPSNRVTSMNIGSNQEGEFLTSAPECGKTYYFAIRAYDIYGNGSGVIGDSVIKVVGGTTTEVAPTEAGAIPVTYVTLPKEGKPEVLGKETKKEEKKEKEEVVKIPGKRALENILGAATKKENRTKVIIVGIVLLAIIGYGVYLIKKKKA